jgi:hypothetical protein
VSETALRARFHAALRAFMRSSWGDEGAADAADAVHAAALLPAARSSAARVVIAWRQERFDAFDLFAEVQSWGGAEKCTLAVQWNACGRALGALPTTDFGNAMQAVYRGRQGAALDGTPAECPRVCVRGAPRHTPWHTLGALGRPPGPQSARPPPTTDAPRAAPRFSAARAATCSRSRPRPRGARRCRRGGRWRGARRARTPPPPPPARAAPGASAWSGRETTPGSRPPCTP